MGRAMVGCVLFLLLGTSLSMLTPTVTATPGDWDGRRGFEEIEVGPGEGTSLSLEPMAIPLIVGVRLRNASAVNLTVMLDCEDRGVEEVGKWNLTTTHLTSFIAPACPGAGTRWMLLDNQDGDSSAILEITVIEYDPQPVEEGTFQFRVDPGETRGKLVFISDQPMIATIRVLTGDWANLWVMPLTNYSINLNLSMDFPYSYWDAIQGGENTSFLILPLLDAETETPLLQILVIDNRRSPATMTVWFSVLPADDAVRKGAIRDAIIASMLPVALVGLALYFYYRDRGAAAEVERAMVPTHRPDPRYDGSDAKEAD